MPIHESQLPQAMRQRARGMDPGAKTRAPAQRSTPVPYECVACGWRFTWTSNDTPVKVDEHAIGQGHARFQMVLDSPG